ncbi:universal stress protein [Natrarchaeobius sp. A-rgal3]|uniref:universal stress protein n=1 Tax=Natrarchaeobius versutus TaxID=1679078 RepID=UPI00350FE26C
MYETILIPTDGSDSADSAVEHAFELAKRYDASVHAMYCVETHRYGEPALSSTELVLDRLEDAGAELLQGIHEQADDHGIQCTSNVCHGRPWDEVREKAGDLDADLVVIGFQGQSRSLPGKIGSVAERVLRTSDRPVLTV